MTAGGEHLGPVAGGPSARSPERIPGMRGVWNSGPVTDAPPTGPTSIAVAPATDPDTGLTSAEVAERTSRGQVNATEQATSRPLWTIIKSNVFTRFNAILGVLFVLVLTTGSFADGLFGVILIVNSGIGIVQEYLAKRKLDQLALLNQPTTRVVRDGRMTEIATSDVVLGELVELRAGDQVPADGHLHSVSGLEVDESNLTGESDPMPKQADDDVRSGTTVVAGSGRFVAAAVGADSYVNTIAAQAKTFTKTHSEIQASVNTLLKYITWVIVLALPLQIWSQVQVYGADDWRTVIVRSTGGLVGLVPEGLVLLTSVAFLLAAVSLSRQQVLVQELPAVEGLARVDVVCLDKTETLTVGDIAYDCCDPVGISRCPSGTWRRPSARWPTTPTRTERSGRWPRPSTLRRAGIARRPSPSTRPASGVPRRSPTAGPTSSARPTCCSPWTTHCVNRFSRRRGPVCGWCCWGTATPRSTGRSCPSGCARSPWCR